MATTDSTRPCINYESVEYLWELGINGGNTLYQKEPLTEIIIAEAEIYEQAHPLFNYDCCS